MPPRKTATASSEGFVSPLEDPEAVTKALSAAINDMPAPVPPPDTLVHLPGGLLLGSETLSTAEVRELTGEHEEILARAAQAVPGNVFHFMNALLECGTVRIGTEEPGSTRKLLKNLLVGDRDALIIGIRKATYGDDIEIEKWVCPNCGESSDLVVPLADIPVRELGSIRENQVFTLPLRKGRTAEVRLATGADQLAVFEERKLSIAERDTLLLSRCLLSITDPDDTKHTTAGFALTYARGLSVPDRHAILRELNDRQPGPRISDMTIKHDTCGEEVDLMLGIVDLFRDISLA